MRRLIILAVAFAIELTVLSLLVDGQSLLAQPSQVVRLLGSSGMAVLHFLVSLLALGATFTYLKRRTALDAFRREMARTRLPGWLIALHLFLFGGLLVVGQRLYGGTAPQVGRLVAVFLALGSGVLVSGLATVAPLGVWRRLIGSVGAVWAYALVAALAAVLMTAGWRGLWQPASVVTYWLVQLMLRPLLGNLIVQPEIMRVATGRFGVIISPECSGLEGLGLLLLFGVVWLWMYRKECRFPQALLLLPAGLVTLFLLNSARIALLVLIGHLGAKQIATQGFHSQAGWIAFNAVALGLCIAAGRIPWIAERGTAPREKSVNLVAVYLAPLLGIVAAGMLARALTGCFEWLYPLRFLAACTVFWIYRREYRKIDWRFTWRGPAIGLLVFGVWMGMESALEGSPAEAAPNALQMAPRPLQWGWLAVRVLCTVIAVPVAEELAFRGYLIRRLMAENFAKLPPVLFSMWALAASSLLFGAMHQARWLSGTAAGVIYALVYLRKGQLGDAVVAHAVTNALIATSVLGLGYWKLW